MHSQCARVRFFSISSPSVICYSFSFIRVYDGYCWFSCAVVGFAVTVCLWISIGKCVRTFAMTEHSASINKWESVYKSGKKSIENRTKIVKRIEWWHRRPWQKKNDDRSVKECGTLGNFTITLMKWEVTIEKSHKPKQKTIKWKYKWKYEQKSKNVALAFVEAQNK